MIRLLLRKQKEYKSTEAVVMSTSAVNIVIFKVFKAPGVFLERQYDFSKI